YSGKSRSALPRVRRIAHKEKREARALLSRSRFVFSCLTVRLLCDLRVGERAASGEDSPGMRGWFHRRSAGEVLRSRFVFSLRRVHECFEPFSVANRLERL